MASKVERGIEVIPGGHGRQCEGSIMVGGLERICRKTEVPNKVRSYLFFDDFLLFFPLFFFFFFDFFEFLSSSEESLANATVRALSGLEDRFDGDDGVLKIDLGFFSKSSFFCLFFFFFLFFDEALLELAPRFEFFDCSDFGIFCFNFWISSRSFLFCSLTFFSMI